MMEIVVATRNPKKVEEIRRILKSMDITLKSLDDYPDMHEVVEDGRTFEENAVKKALAVSEHTKKTALADDSGLEVYALGNAPGVYSARYAGENATDADNLNIILKELISIPDEKRGGRFVCVIALAKPDGTVITFHGTVEGKIGETPIGSNGFGYDPVFYPLGHDKTFAQMPGHAKDGMSHRGEALKKLRHYLQTETPDKPS